MTQYLITKREKCDYYEHYSGGHANCKHCDKQGNIDTPVDLLEVLARVRWTEIGDIITKDGYEKGVVDLRFNNLTIED